jgi:hypothetical protein
VEAVLQEPTDTELKSPLTAQQLGQMLAAALAAGRGREDGLSLLTDNDPSEISGARGASAYGKEKLKYERNPGEAWRDFRLKTRSLLARSPTEPTKFGGLIAEIPWGTFNTAKRAFALLCSVADSLELGDLEAARGRVAQGCRWLVLAFDTPRDPTISWRLTFLPDPVPIVSPSRSAVGLDLNASILEPSQLTATLGMARDLELLNKRMAGNGAEGGGGGKSRGEKPKPQKDPKGKAAAAATSGAQ